jgi:outer membrane protein assembly factor BamB
MQIDKVILPPRVLSSKPKIFAVQKDIYALEPSNGIVLWHYPLHGLSEATILEDTIYINYQHSNKIQALHAITGSLLWQSELEGKLLFSPTISDGIVYVSTNEGNIYALEASTGNFLWRYETASVLLASPTAVSNCVYFTTASPIHLTPSLYALHTENGSLLWQSSIPSSSWYPPSVLNGIIYICTHTTCCAFQASDGSFCWQREMGGNICSSPVLVDKAIYITYFKPKYNSFSSESEQFHLKNHIFIRALQVNDGSFLWEQELGRDTNANYSTPPVVAQNRIYIGTDDGYLSALNCNYGAFLWRYKTDSTLLSVPAVRDEYIYVGGNDGNVYALYADDGALQWQKFIDDALTISAVDLKIDEI